MFTESAQEQTYLTVGKTKMEKSRFTRQINEAGAKADAKTKELKKKTNSTKNLFYKKKSLANFLIHTKVHLKRKS